jgi:hypothetical protein
MTSANSVKRPGGFPAGPFSFVSTNAIAALPLNRTSSRIYSADLAARRPSRGARVVVSQALGFYGICGTS